MKKLHSMILCLLIGFLFFSVPSPKVAAALELLVSGACSFPPPNEFWISAVPELRSDPGSILLHVVDDGGRDEPWRIEVRLQGAPLPGEALMSVRRTGTGQGFGWIDGGLAFVPLGERPVILCSGAGDRMQIPLQVKFSGINPSTPSGDVRSGILFTVVTQP